MNRETNPELSFLASHCASQMNQFTNLKIDGKILIYLRVCEFEFVKVSTKTDWFHCNSELSGTHHTADVDHLPNRGGVPWGALLNSSHRPGKSGKSSVNCNARANCRMEWILSAHLSPDDLSNNREAFLATTRDIKAGEELMWPYYVDFVALQSNLNEVIKPPRRLVPRPRVLEQASRHQIACSLAASAVVNEEPITECKCRTECVGICINAPLPMGATRVRKARRIDY